jgi:hypothetical protein
MLLKVALIVGIAYFAIATYGGSYYVGPAMICALSFWMYHLPKKDKAA